MRRFLFEIDIRTASGSVETLQHYPATADDGRDLFEAARGAVTSAASGISELRLWDKGRLLLQHPAT